MFGNQALQAAQQNPIVKKSTTNVRKGTAWS
jgi:hypothetical protein